jgi:hypothetical protein
MTTLPVYPTDDSPRSLTYILTHSDSSILRNYGNSYLDHKQTMGGYAFPYIIEHEMWVTTGGSMVISKHFHILLYLYYQNT